MRQPQQNDRSPAGRCQPATIALIALCLFISMLVGCAGSAKQGKTAAGAIAEAIKPPDESQLQVPAQRFVDLAPADPQPAGDALRPGLSVVYYFEYFARHLDPFTSGNFPSHSATAGKPIPYLDHRFGQEDVFDSGTNRGVAMRMKGLIRFPTPGEYTFRALSNDGLRIRIADTLIIDDPTQHSDRYAVQAVVTINDAGWYPLAVEYFQRKGTASIGLYWQTPGANDFAAVPPTSFAHHP